MPLVFTKLQIRRYLAEMGFEDIDDDQLNAFIKDLKKLVKHEDRTRKARKLAAAAREHEQSQEHSITTSVNNKTFQSDSNSVHSLNSEVEPEQRNRPNARNVLENLRHKTKSSKATMSAANDNTQDSEHRRFESDEKFASGIFAHSSHEDQHINRDHLHRDPSSDVRIGLKHRRHEILSRDNQLEGLKLRKSNEVEKSDGKVNTRIPISDSNSLESLPSTIRSSSSGSIVITSGAPSKSISSTSSGEDGVLKRRQNIPDSIKRDPVALYHYYNSYWIKQKPPGADKHMQLRWNVRAGTMGRVPCTPCGERVNYLTRY